MKSFELDPEGKWIRCLDCNRISHHPLDVKERYCGRCHKFHEDGQKKGEAA